MRSCEKISEPHGNAIKLGVTSMCDLWKQCPLVADAQPWNMLCRAACICVYYCSKKRKSSKPPEEVVMVFWRVTTP